MQISKTRGKLLWWHLIVGTPFLEYLVKLAMLLIQLPESRQNT